MTYDCFTYNGEEDILEIRFSILDNYVDRFVLCESKQTFSGKKKPLYYAQNKARFDKWNHKVIYLEAPEYDAPDAFQRAHFQKEYLKKGLKETKDEDIVFFGDVDEIWSSSLLEYPPTSFVWFEEKNWKEFVFNLNQLNYCYSLNQRSSERWVGTIMGKWRFVKENTFTFWRANHEYEMQNGGWHFTNMGGLEQVQRKLESYDHQEYNNDEIKQSLKARIENGQDYVGRNRDWQGKSFEMWIDESELPCYILENREKYKHLFRVA